MYDDTSIPKPNCPPIDCKKKGDCCITTRKVLIPSIFSDKEGEYKTANGLFCDAIVEYEANGHVYIYSSDGIPTQIKSDSTDNIKLYDTTGDNTDGAMTQKATTEALNTKQNTLTAGDGVVIENNVISAASATVDSALSYISENPVQNKVITEALDGKVNSSEIANLATKAELQTKADKTELDNYTTTADLDAQLALKADKTQLGNYATIADMNAGLDAKQDILTAGTNIAIENNVISSTVDTSTFATKTELNDKADKSTTYTKTEVDDLLDDKVFVAEYNVTTAAELLAYMNSTNEPFAPIVVKRGNDYYTAILSAPSGTNGVVVRVLGSGSGDYYVFNYTVTGNTWSSSSYGLQKKLVSGTDIKTINGESLLGSGNIEVGGSTVTVDDALSTTSENPVQNKVITTALNGKADTSDIPDISNLATKTELTTGLAGKVDTATLADYATTQALTTGLATKQDTLTAGDGISITSNTISATNRGSVDVVPSNDEVTVNDPDGLNSASLQVGGAGVLFDISGSQVAELANKAYVDNVASGDYIVDTTGTLPTYSELTNALLSGKTVKMKYLDNGHIRYATVIGEYTMEQYFASYTGLDEGYGGSGKLENKTFSFSYDDDGVMSFDGMSTNDVTTSFNTQVIESGTGTAMSLTKNDYNFALQQPTDNPAALRAYFRKTVAGTRQIKTFDVATIQTTEVYNENSTAADFNPVVTEYVKDNGVTYTKYRFYYKTTALPAANATKTFNFSTLMSDYTVKEWTNVSGFTDNGHKLSSGRTDNLGNVAILQQLGRNSKELIIRSYGDLSARTAILQLEFYGTKN